MFGARDQTEYWPDFRSRTARRRTKLASRKLDNLSLFGMQVGRSESFREVFFVLFIGGVTDQSMVAHNMGRSFTRCIYTVPMAWGSALR